VRRRVKPFGRGAGLVRFVREPFTHEDGDHPILRDIVDLPLRVDAAA